MCRTNWQTQGHSEQHWLSTLQVSQPASRQVHSLSAIPQYCGKCAARSTSGSCSPSAASCLFLFPLQTWSAGFNISPVSNSIRVKVGTRVSHPRDGDSSTSLSSLFIIWKGTKFIFSLSKTLLYTFIKSFVSYSVHIDGAILILELHTSVSTSRFVLSQVEVVVETKWTHAGPPVGPVFLWYDFRTFCSTQRMFLVLQLCGCLLLTA